MRCRSSFGFRYFEILPSNPHASPDGEPKIDKPIEIGSLIRRLRLRRGLTQAVLAYRTGINRTYISRAERGRVVPSVITLMKIAPILGVDKILLRVQSPTV